MSSTEEQQERFNAYNSGRFGGSPPSSSGHFTEYWRGQAERRADEERRAAEERDRAQSAASSSGSLVSDIEAPTASSGAGVPSTPASPAQAALAFVGLILAFFVFHLVYVAVMGLIAGVVIFIVVRLLVWKRAPSFARVYVAAVCAFFVYSIVTILVSRTLGHTEALRQLEAQMANEEVFMRRLRQHPSILLPALPAVAAIQLPALLAFGAVLARMIGRPFVGVAGYAKAVVVGVVALAVTVGVALVGISAIMR